MIRIRKSATADTRTIDFQSLSTAQLCDYLEEAAEVTWKIGPLRFRAPILKAVRRIEQPDDVWQRRFMLLAEEMFAVSAGAKSVFEFRHRWGGDVPELIEGVDAALGKRKGQ